MKMAAKKKTVKKKGVAVRKPHRAPVAPKKKPALVFKVGKKYADREGSVLTIKSLKSDIEGFPILATQERHGIHCFHFTEGGGFYKNRKSSWDLVQEVKPPRPSARKK